MVSSWLYEPPLWVVFPLCLAIILGASAAGWRLGVRLDRRGGGGAGPHIGTLQAALFGLLSLLIGFTFSIALTRFEARRDVVLAEANAISSLASRAMLLPQPAAAEVTGQLRRYVDLRIEFGDDATTPERRAEVTAASIRLLDGVWQSAAAAMTRGPDASAPRLVVEALDEVSSLRAKRLAAERSRVPMVVFLLLYLLAIVTLGMAGFAGGAARTRGFGPIAITGLAMAAIIVMIADLDRPHHGLIAVNQQALRDLHATFAP